MGLLAFASIWFGAAAAGWERVEVPGATCGDGSPYAVYLRAGDPARLLFYFDGGGACWDAVTCSGYLVRTGPAAGPPGQKVFWAGKDDDVYVGAEAIFFPYCTGDVYVGRHVADYGWGVRMRHVGADDVEAALRLLFEGGRVDPSRAREVVVVGESSGAIGGAFHSVGLSRWLPRRARKTLILDSPGLHFGDSFWRKFPARMIDDFRAALARVGVPLDPSDGLLARHAGAVCARFPDWTIGVLQASRDAVMSLVFGAELPSEHERRAYGPDGLWRAFESPFDHCSAWMPPSYWHVFLHDHDTASMRAGGMPAIEFARDLIEGRGGLSYR